MLGHTCRLNPLLLVRGDMLIYFAILSYLAAYGIYYVIGALSLYLSYQVARGIYKIYEASKQSTSTIFADPLIRIGERLRYKIVPTNTDVSNYRVFVLPSRISCHNTIFLKQQNLRANSYPTGNNPKNFYIGGANIGNREGNKTAITEAKLTSMIGSFRAKLVKEGDDI